MTPADLLGGVILASLVLYALLGGADFGGGIWDLLASGPRRREQRELVEHAIGPIWEANHVWLILVVVVLFTGFPAAFAAISIALFVPLVLLLLGIVLRGAAFTFRTYDVREDRVQARWGLVFSGSSVLAPVVLGVVVGALSSGRLRVAADGAEPFAWVAPFPLSVGLFAAALFAYLAATYLAVEAQGLLREDFRHRAVASGVAVFLCAALSGALSWREAPLVFEGLTRRPWSVPFHVATGAAAVAAFGLLATRRVRAARAAAAVQVALVVLGWGASQYPYVLVPDLTLASASGPRATQVALLWALGGGALLLFPSLYVLFRVFKGERPFSVVDRGT
ncbi:MAG TPA: cytochrome d ubiquinol oxidase subunit II [Anaeromyxobacter sp.]